MTRDAKVLRGLRLAVPFYKNPQLVRPLFESLLACEEECHRLGVRLCFYNDSPEDPGLRAELEACVRERRSLALEVIDCPRNLGFIGTMNLAIQAAVEAREDIILLNSDTYVFEGALTELQQVAYTDPLIGFVSPRSNHATLCTFPHGSERLGLSPAEGHRRWRAASSHLDRVAYVPTAVGFCLFIKWSILAELGGLDPIYGMGYNEENDLIMRANRLGYRAAMANHAFVWHQGEQSFGTLDQKRLEREKANGRLLKARYPEYQPLVDLHFQSPEYRAEGLLGQLVPDAEGRLRIGFDFSGFKANHNGTHEAGKKLLQAAVQCWPPEIDILVCMDRKPWDFHELDRFQRIRRVEVEGAGEPIAAMVRMGQTSDPESLRRLVMSTPVFGVFMLDAISADCGYLRVKLDESAWRFTTQWADLVFTNSAFTADQFTKRYPFGSRTRLVPSLHSVTLADYRLDSRNGEKAPEGILVIGNAYAHKALLPTVKALAEAFPDVKITAIGCAGDAGANVTCLPSGSLTDEEMHACFEACQVVVFPSHYEGFGFPVLHALAHGKPVMVRSLPVFEEIADRITPGRENIHGFETTQDLVDRLASGLPAWKGPEAIGEARGWERSALEVLAALREAMASATQAGVAERIRWFQAAYAPAMSLGESLRRSLKRAEKRFREFRKGLR